MVQALAVAGNLDWKGWGLGIMGAFVSGAAGAISSMSAVSLIGGSDPDHKFASLPHVLEIGAATFLISGVISLAKYLQMHPVPEVPTPTAGN